MHMEYATYPASAAIFWLAAMPASLLVLRCLSKGLFQKGAGNNQSARRLSSRSIIEGPEIWARSRGQVSYWREIYGYL